MGNTQFEYEAYKLIKDYYSNYLDNDEVDGYNYIYTVWICKTLQNNKGLFSTNIDGDSHYFEVTYNGDKKEFYLDAYIKENNILIKQ